MYECKLLIEKNKDKITIEYKSNSDESLFLVTIYFMFLKIKMFCFCNFDRENNLPIEFLPKEKLKCCTHSEKKNNL